MVYYWMNFFNKLNTSLELDQMMLVPMFLPIQDNEIG